MTAPTILRTRTEFAQACDEARAAGQSVGLVPTMGALHDGHFSLMRAARARHEFVVATIFVNPLQFAAGEDLDRYPRTFEADIEGCRRERVRAVFAPEIAAMYPDGFQSEVAVTGITQPLEGEFRPSHFRGVTTVVNKLFNLAGDCTAYFGRKDYQQWKMIERMAFDLDMRVRVVGCAIIRESDGLAMSSRNRYLSADHRARSLAIVAGLRAAHDAWHRGERDVDVLQALAHAPVEHAFDAIDYVAVRDADTMLPLSRSPERAVVAVAAHLGATRLIDNTVLGEDPRP